MPTTEEEATRSEHAQWETGGRALGRGNPCTGRGRQPGPCQRGAESIQRGHWAGRWSHACPETTSDSGLRSFFFSLQPRSVFSLDLRDGGLAS
jgi:hypothetical protein